MIIKIVLLSIIYIIGFITSYKFMFNYFKRDNLSDKAFKIHVIFLSTIWPLFWTLWVIIITVPLLFIFTFCYIASLFEKKRS